MGTCGRCCTTRRSAETIGLLLRIDAERPRTVLDFVPVLSTRMQIDVELPDEQTVRCRIITVL